MRHRFSVLLAASTILAGTGVISASPANAAASTIGVTCNGTTVSFSPSSLANAVSSDTITMSMQGPFNASVTVSGASGPSSLTGMSSPTTGTYTVSSNSGGSIALTVTSTGGPCSVGASATFTFTGTSPAPSGGSTVATTETLSLALSASGATCTGGNPTGYAGSWLTLPGSDQCSQSGPTAKPGAKLLGWSTSANFPVARAQAQIDKKWGVIDEEIDGVRMIFIPGGMAVFVSGSNNLYPIWSA